MSAGDRWRLPDGRDALELQESTADTLVAAPIVPNWPFPAPSVLVARALCQRLPSRYHAGAGSQAQTPPGVEALL